MVTEDGPRTDVADRVIRTYYPDYDVNVNRRGRIATVTNGAGHTTTFDDYDVYGTARTITDPNGVVTRIETDPRGRTISRTIRAVAGDPSETVEYTTTWTYDTRDRLVEIRSPRGIVTRFGYENGTNWQTDTIRVNETGNEFERHHVTYNGLGQKTREEDQACSIPSDPCTTWITKRSESFVYDANNRLAQIQHADGTSVSYTYDDAGKLTSVQDENHSTPNTSYSYDELDRLTAVVQTLAATAVTTRYDYDAADNLIKVTDPNTNLTTYVFDDFHRMVQQTSPVTGTTTYTYDEAGNLIRTTDANSATTARTYDTLNRVTTSTSTRTGTTTEATTWTYDTGTYGLGRLASLTDNSGSTTYAYERRGLLKAEHKTIASTTYDTSYAYDADGNRTTIAYPSGRSVTSTYDYANRPSTTTAGGAAVVSSATYQPFGPLSSLTYGNGTTKTVTYDSRYRPLQNTLMRSGATIADYRYATDAVGNITQIKDTTTAGYDRTFGYDGLNRLTTANSGFMLWGNGSYTYDSMGNRLSATLGSHTQSLSYSGTTPVLASVTIDGTTRNIAHDLVGNETSDGAITSAYSAGNHLATAGNLAYTYDGRGVRTVMMTSSAPALSSISVAPTAIPPGGRAEGTITLVTPGANDVPVTLSSDDPQLVIPSWITIPAGTLTATFAITAPTNATERNATLTATCAGQQTASLSVTSQAPPTLTTLTLSPNPVVGSNTATGTVTVSGTTTADLVVTLASSDPSVNVPPSVTIPNGLSSANFTISTATVPGPLDVAITARAVTTFATILSVRTAPLATFDLASRIIGRTTATGTVTLNTPAPSGGAVINLSSSNTSALTVPAGITIPSGSTAASFTAQAVAVTSTSSSVVTASYDGDSKTATVTVPVCSLPIATPPETAPDDRLWVEDATPPGAALTGTWIWDTSQKVSGSQSHTDPSAAGYHRHYFTNANLTVDSGDVFVFYVLMNPCDMPRELFVQWYDGTGWEHRAIWGENLIASGTYGTESRFPMGNLPRAGQWVKLQVPAVTIGLAGRTISGMAFGVYNGQAWWDHVGTNSCTMPTDAAPTMVADNVWVEDATPAGATLVGTWQWDTARKATGTQAHTDPAAVAYHSHNFNTTPQPLAVSTGDTLVVYAYQDPCNPPGELFLQWHDGTGWEHRAFWGGNLVSWGTTGTASRYNMGNLPPTGQWVRLEIPASLVGMQGRSIYGMAFGAYGGRVWWDHAGIAGRQTWGLTSFAADHVSAQPAGTTITWTAGASGSGNPEFRFERLDGTTWKTVQAYGSQRTYMWTPGDGDTGTHLIRVSIRTVGASIDAEDVRVSAMTIIGRNGSLRRPGLSLFARWRERRERDAMSLGVTVRLLDTSPLTRYSLYTPELQLLSQTELGGTAIAYDYLWFGGTPVAQIDNATSTVHYTFTDHLGTPLLQTDASGVVDWRAEYEPYGRIYALRAGQGRHQPLRFPGQESDEFETAANGDAERSYNIFRWYRGGWGQYTQADPLLTSDEHELVDPSGELDPNAFAYAFDNPLLRTDPYGLFTYQNTGPVDPELEKKLTCLDNCMGKSVNVNGGQEAGHGWADEHSPNGHMAGKAADMSCKANPGLCAHKNKMLCCIGACDFGYGKFELKGVGNSTGDHFHVQKNPHQGSQPKECKGNCSWIPD